MLAPTVSSEPPPPTPNPRLPKLLVLEFWGLGDLTFATALLRRATQHYEVTLVGKPHARALLGPTFPQIRFLDFDAPWSAWRRKYKLWNWNWPKLLGLIGRLRRERFAAAVSVRKDPRDHFLLWLTGAGRRLSFPHRRSGFLLTEVLPSAPGKQHRVEDWTQIADTLGLDSAPQKGPQLDHPRYRSPTVDALLPTVDRPMVCLHPGARISVRRWPEAYFAEIIRRLRREFDFHLVLVPDPDGYGSELVPLADTVLRPLSVPELVDVLGRVDLVLCNDSGPGHLAASCHRPTITIFGPTDPQWFRPWGDLHHVIIREICPWRPCFDYCKFSEPHCMTKLQPAMVWPEMEEQIRSLVRRGIVPEKLLKPAPASVVA